MTLVFDTETTGKALFNSPVSDPKQPRMVQLGAILMDSEWRVRAEVNLIAGGFEIPKEASDIHGITTAMAESCGVPPHLLLTAFIELSKHADVVVAHNFAFDRFIMACEMARQTDCIGSFDHLKDKHFCTMHATTPLCKLPGNYGDYKWPKLIEAYRHAFNEDFEGAHDAMADVRACSRLYRWLKEKEVANVQP